MRAVRQPFSTPPEPGSQKSTPPFKKSTLTDHLQSRHPALPQEVVGQKRDFEEEETEEVELAVEDESPLAGARSGGETT